MASRPVFIPREHGTVLVDTVNISFVWNPGMSVTQKKKNVAALHRAAADRNLQNLVEISSKSDHLTGQRLSAFYVKVDLGGRETTLECAFQASKVFERGGPYDDLLWVESREAKRDPRLRDSGKLIAFHFRGHDFPLSPPTIFYDWLYVNALYRYREWLAKLQLADGFTDIEFNPEKSINCQAKSLATFVALQRRNLLDDAISSFAEFEKIMKPSAF